MKILLKSLLGICCLAACIMTSSGYAMDPIYMGSDRFVIKQAEASSTYQLYCPKKDNWTGYTFPEEQQTQPVLSSSAALFRLNGIRIEKLVACSPLGKWSTYTLKKPLVGEALPIIGESVGAYYLPGRVVAYSGVSNSWGAIQAERPPYVMEDTVIAYTSDVYSAFSAHSGSWSSVSKVNPHGHIVTRDLIAVTGLDERTLHVFSRQKGRWQSHTFAEGIEFRPVMSEGVAAFSTIGNNQKRLYAVGGNGKWTSTKLEPSFSGTISPIVSDEIACFDIGDHVIGFSSTNGKWDTVKSTGHPSVHQSSIVIQEEGSVLIFNSETGRWSRGYR